MALAGGALLPLQAGLNSKLGKSIGNPLQAVAISFVVGMLVLLLYLLATRQVMPVENLRAAPAYSWFGGALGAFFVTSMTLAYPRIGPALTFGLVIAGQTIMAVLLEHFKIMVAEQHSINWGRLLGVVLLIAGVFIIRRF